jgi:very-short-patch-repair endonuclease
MASKNARQLRSNATDAELCLWSALRRRQVDGLRFRRQVPLGRFIADFACYDARLVVELDGGQHVENGDDDAARTQWLKSRGFRVLRFWNQEIFENLDGVLAVIRQAASSCAGSPDEGRVGSRGKQ